MHSVQLNNSAGMQQRLTAIEQGNQNRQLADTQGTQDISIVKQQNIAADASKYGANAKTFDASKYQTQMHQSLIQTHKLLHKIKQQQLRKELVTMEQTKRLMQVNYRLKLLSPIQTLKHGRRISRQLLLLLIQIHKLLHKIKQQQLRKELVTMVQIKRLMQVNYRLKHQSLIQIHKLNHKIEQLMHKPDQLISKQQHQ